MFQFETEQKVCEVGGVKFGGQPGAYPTVVCPSIFQKGDKIFDGKRKEGFDEKTGKGTSQGPGQTLVGDRSSWHGRHCGQYWKGVQVVR